MRRQYHCLLLLSQHELGSWGTHGYGVVLIVQVAHGHVLMLLLARHCRNGCWGAQTTAESLSTGLVAGIGQCSHAARVRSDRRRIAGGGQALVLAEGSRGRGQWSSAARLSHQARVGHGGLVAAGLGLGPWAGTAGTAGRDREECVGNQLPRAWHEGAAGAGVLLGSRCGEELGVSVAHARFERGTAVDGGQGRAKRRRWLRGRDVWQ